MTKPSHAFAIFAPSCGVLMPKPATTGIFTSDLISLSRASSSGGSVVRAPVVPFTVTA